MSDLSVLELLERGGVLMYVITALGVVGVAVALERLVALRQGRVVPAAMAGRVRELCRESRFDAAREVLTAQPSPLAAVLLPVLRRVGHPLVDVKDAVEEAGRQEAAGLERFCATIGTVASVAPLLGLLGTVTGMISVFQTVAISGAGSPLDLASGIWQALLTTALGLVVGVFTLMLHRYVLSRVDARVLELEREALDLLELVGVVTGAAGAPAFVDGIATRPAVHEAPRPDDADPSSDNAS